jgi:hypothetical protein
MHLAEHGHPQQRTEGRMLLVGPEHNGLTLAGRIWESPTDPPDHGVSMLTQPPAHRLVNAEYMLTLYAHR